LQPSQTAQQRFDAFKGTYGGEASFQDFLRGYEDGRRLASPAEGPEQIGPALFDANAALAMAQDSSAKAPDDVHHQWRLAQQMETLLDAWKQQQAPASAVQKLEAKRRELLQKVTALEPG